MEYDISNYIMPSAVLLHGSTKLPQHPHWSLGLIYSTVIYRKNSVKLMYV